MASLASPKPKPGHRLAVSAAEHGNAWLEFFRYLNYVGLGFCLFAILWAGWEMVLAHESAVREVRRTFGDPPQILSRDLNSADPGAAEANATNR